MKIYTYKREDKLNASNNNVSIQINKPRMTKYNRYKHRYYIDKELLQMALENQRKEIICEIESLLFTEPISLVFHEERPGVNIFLIDELNLNDLITNPNSYMNPELGLSYFSNTEISNATSYIEATKDMTMLEKIKYHFANSDTNDVVAPSRNYDCKRYFDKLDNLPDNDFLELVKKILIFNEKKKEHYSSLGFLCDTSLYNLIVSYIEDKSIAEDNDEVFGGEMFKYRGLIIKYYHGQGTIVRIEFE